MIMVIEWYVDEDNRQYFMSVFTSQAQWTSYAIFISLYHSSWTTSFYSIIIITFSFFYLIITVKTSPLSISTRKTVWKSCEYWNANPEIEHVSRWFQTVCELLWACSMFHNYHHLVLSSFTSSICSPLESISKYCLVSSQRSHSSSLLSSYLGISM